MPTASVIDARHPTPAVVIGLCAHGLAIARALRRAGVGVIGLESRAGVPGLRTRCAEIASIDDMNGPRLVDELLRLHPRLFDRGMRPVLLPTNDRMVEQLSFRVPELQQLYRLSWHESAEAIRALLAKDRIESRCRALGLSYPKSVTCETESGASLDLREFRFPLILKPVRPLGRFKTAIVHSPAQLDRLLLELADELPILIQEFIPGDDTAIQFAALVLDRGQVRARFEGRKLRSRPMGHTTLAVSEPDDGLHQLALRFFEGLQLSGPVSLEMKSDPAGERWVIEPTVGRSDFWVGLCVSNGVNLPLIEYQIAIDAPEPPPAQRQGFGWVNGERDPGGLLWLLSRKPVEVFARRWRGVYLDPADPMPLIAALRQSVTAFPARVGRWTRRRLSRHG